MEYSKVQVSVAGTASFRALPAGVRTVWFQACIQCAMEETGGILPGAAAWKDGQWRAALGVSAKDVAAAITACLLKTDGHNIVVVGYDTIGEATALRERETTRKRIRDWRNGKSNASSTADVTPLQKEYERRCNASSTASPGPGPGPGPSDNPNTPSPGSSVNIPTGKHPAGGGSRKVSALKPIELVHAIRSGDLFQVLAAFKANTDPSRDDDWLRECDELSVSIVGAILYDGYEKRSPVREPSGFRAARLAYEAAPDAVRKACSENLRDYVQPALDTLDKKATA